ncbi:hypothetical protein [Luteipulveratus mongoliensis]|uniref:Uncharacterized protein n=1 Tax=Luteipulveratus mongoliensis TaxID=571913 RepID=A0A0K1JKC5_9MICO|nr:hypothetical protein [Luteipulveratus mongoliensis]AKU17167.1 hypothetical protein VV02_17070 [Luteipulveratus mongoliensis]
MTGAWRWTYEDEAGQPVTGDTLVTTGFPTQSDAESWLGEQWRDLAEHSVSAVTLYEDDTVVYGPMSLSDGS